MLKYVIIKPIFKRGDDQEIMIFGRSHPVVLYQYNSILVSL